MARDFRVNSQSCLSFIEELRKHDAKVDHMNSKVHQMLLKVTKGDLSGFKSRIGSSDLPKEALSFLNGLDIEEENQEIKVEAL